MKLSIDAKELQTLKKDIDTLRNKIRQEAVQKSLKPILDKSLPELKNNLMSIIKTTPAEGQTPPTTKNTVQESINVPESKEVILEHLTGAKVSSFNKSKDSTDYYNTSGPKIINVNRSANNPNPSRVSLNIPTSEGETVQSQYLKAQQFFKDSMFAFPGLNGAPQFTKNIDSGIMDALKIKCSSYTGDDDFEDHGGMSPERRFETDNINSGIAVWTLKQDYVDRVKREGLNISRVVDNLIDNDPDAAVNYLNSLGNKDTKVINKLKEKIVELQTEENLLPKTQSQVNIIKLINNLTIVMKPGKRNNKFILKSNYSSVEDIDFLTELQKQISIWKNINIDVWTSELIKRINTVVKEFYRT